MALMHLVSVSPNSSSFFFSGVSSSSSFAAAMSAWMALRAHLSRQHALSALQRCLAPHAPNLRGHAGAGDDADSLAVADGGSSEDHALLRLKLCAFVLDWLRELCHRHRLASQASLLHAQRGCLQLRQPQVRRYLRDATALGLHPRRVVATAPAAQRTLSPTRSSTTSPGTRSRAGSSEICGEKSAGERGATRGGERRVAWRANAPSCRRAASLRAHSAAPSARPARSQRCSPAGGA